MRKSSTAQFTHVFAVLACALWGCGEDPVAPTQESIVGTWDLVQREETDEQGQTRVCDAACLEQEKETYVFNEDGSAISLAYGAETPITWELIGVELYLYYMDKTIMWIYDNYTITEFSFTAIVDWDQGGRTKQVFRRRASKCE